MPEAPRYQFREPYQPGRIVGALWPIGSVYHGSMQTTRSKHQQGKRAAQAHLLFRGAPAAERRVATVLLLLAAAFLGCVWLSGNRVPVYNVIDAPIGRGITVEQVGDAVRRAAQIDNWKVEEVGPQVFYVTKRRGEHSATAEISYRADSFSIELRGSENLKQSDGRIHKLYNEWVRSLESTIRHEINTPP